MERSHRKSWTRWGKYTGPWSASPWNILPGRKWEFQGPILPLEWLSKQAAESTQPQNPPASCLQEEGKYLSEHPRWDGCLTQEPEGSFQLNFNGCPKNSEPNSRCSVWLSLGA